MEIRKLAMDSLANFVAFALIFNVFAFLYAWGFEGVPWHFLLAALPFAGLFVLRRNIKDLGIFIVAHVIFLALPIFLFITGGIYMLIIALLFALALAGYSIASMIKGEWKMKGNVALGCIIIFLLMFMILDAIGTEAQGFYTLIDVSAWLCLALIMLHMHMDNLELKLKSFIKNQKTLVQGSVTAVNNAAISFFVGIIAVFGFISFLAGGNALVFVVQFLRNTIGDFFRFLATLMGLYASEEIRHEAVALFEIPTGDTPAELAFEEPEIAYNWIETFWNMLAPVGFVIIIVVVVGFILNLVKRLRKKLKREVDEKKEIIAQVDTVGKLKFTLGDLAVFLPKFRINTKHPIRKEYIKKVNSHIKRGIKVLPCHTPEKIADKIRSAEDIDKLTEMYESVRYGR